MLAHNWEQHESDTVTVTVTMKWNAGVNVRDAPLPGASMAETGSEYSWLAPGSLVRSRSAPLLCARAPKPLVLALS